jgi:hypothetical protein
MVEELRLRRLMRLRKVYVPDAIDPAATKRCMRCPSARLCEEALAAGDAQSLALFCPNSHYLQQIRSGSLSFS